MEQHPCRPPLVPTDELLLTIHGARPICQFFAKTNKCKKGTKCPYRHQKPITNQFDVPHISVHRHTTDGSLGVHLHQPLEKALDMYARKVCDRGVVNKKRLTDEVCMFELTNMPPPDMDAAENAKQLNHANASDGGLPKFLCHGTTIENALKIICDGRTNPSPGICGHGVYCLASRDYSEDELLATFRRSAVGGYNRGAVIVMEPVGILVKIKDEEVPPGCTSIGKRQNAASHQYSSHPGVLTYRYLIVNVAGLVEQLNRELSRLGYSTELHEHLMTAAQELAAPDVPTGPTIPITNSVIPPGLPK